MAAPGLGAGTSPLNFRSGSVRAGSPEREPLIAKASLSLDVATAMAAGLLDNKGNPAANRPNGAALGPMRRIGGTGGGSVLTQQFNNVPITVTPRSADGTANWDARTIRVSLVVALRPGMQNGTTAATRQAQTSSITTKLCRNVAGATLGEGKLRLIDASVTRIDTESIGAALVPRQAKPRGRDVLRQSALSRR